MRFYRNRVARRNNYEINRKIRKLCKKKLIRQKIIHHQTLGAAAIQVFFTHSKTVTTSGGKSQPRDQKLKQNKKFYKREKTKIVNKQNARKRKIPMPENISEDERKSKSTVITSSRVMQSQTIRIRRVINGTATNRCKNNKNTFYNFLIFIKFINIQNYNNYNYTTNNNNTVYPKIVNNESNINQINNNTHDNCDNLVRNKNGEFKTSCNFKRRHDGIQMKSSNGIEFLCRKCENKNLTKCSNNNNLKNLICVYLYIFIWLSVFMSGASGHVNNFSDSGSGGGDAQNVNVKYSTNVVKTKYGPLRGIMVRSNPPVEAFLGVPYATAPLGNLRYMPPVTPSTWRTTRLADRFSPVCPQAPPALPAGPEALLEVPRGRLAQLRRILPLLANQSEDCLYLNLYVPTKYEDGEKENQSPMATIVYIHGESYEWNSGNPYDGTVLAAHGNVIVVTINFRLGILGFLKTGAKGNTQGNFGLMDLIAGLHWLRENLPFFNGDPNQVTLMGHGTGAALANILIVSPVASDLIHRAILLSGSALSPWAIQKDPVFIKRRVAEHTGCHGDLLADDIAPCLRTKPVADLISISLDTPRFLAGFAPFVDGTVLVNPATTATSPLTLPAGSAIASTNGIELADFPTRELIFGLTSLESYLDLSAQDLEFGFNETRRDRILRTYVRNVYHFHLNEIYSALKNEYTDWERPPRNPLGSRDAALELLSDGHTAAPLVRLSYLHSLRGGKSYFLHFRHQSGELDFPLRRGSVRGEDVPFCLGLPLSPLFPHNYTIQDIKLSRILVRYLSNFAQTGNPNGAQQSSSLLLSSSSSSSSSLTALSSSSADISSLSILNGNFIQKTVKKREINQKIQATKKNKKRRALRSSSGNDAGNTSYENDDENDSSSSVGENYEDEVDDGEEEEEEQQNSSKPVVTTSNEDHKEKLNELASLHVPFWDTYDSINQLYMELGSKAEIKNHYRGHKLSMWLSLIPQLHSPGDTADLSMRHHRFLEEGTQYYDGIVRTQPLIKPPTIKMITLGTTSTTVMKAEVIMTTPSSTTECPPNATIVPTLAATRPQHNQHPNAVMNSNPNNPHSNQNLLRRLATTQYQSYTTALTVTIAVGCFLLLLNIIIFAGIYYQREKRANDAKRKEELTEVENHCSSSTSLEKCSKSSRKSSLQSVAGFTQAASFGEYNCYDEKLKQNEKRALADICSVELPMKDFNCSPAHGSLTDSLCKETFKNTVLNRSQDNLVLYPPVYNSPPLSTSEPSSSNGGGSSSHYHHHQHHHHPQQQQCNQTKQTSNHHYHYPPEQCNQSTQSEQPSLQDVGTTVNEHDVELQTVDSPEIPQPPPPPRSTAPFQGGILRGGPSTPGTTKKRVQIQEISV